MKLDKHYPIIALLYALFILITLKGLATPMPGDENVYYYMGKLIAEGSAPYRDFFYAHPPVQLYVISIFFKMFGFNLFLLKLIPYTATLVTAFLLYLISKRLFGKYEAVVSLLLFLFSYSVMFNSVLSFGISLATMLVVIGFYLFLSKRPFISGIFFGLAGFTRMLALIPVAAMFIFLLFKNRKNLVSVSLGFLLAFAIPSLALIGMFGSDYTTPVYKFHLLKTPSSLAASEYTGVIKLNWILFTGFAAIFFLGKTGKTGLFVFISLVYLVSLTLLSRVFGFYFLVAFPFMAMIAGYSIMAILNFIKHKLSGKGFTVVIILLLAIFAWNLVSDVLFLHKAGFEGFKRGEDIRAELSGYSPATPLFGDDSITPLIALMTDKKIAFDYFSYVDTNPAVFRTGVVDLGKLLSELKGSDIIFIARNIQGIAEFEDVRNFLNNDCALDSSFNDGINGVYFLYICSAG